MKHRDIFGLILLLVLVSCNSKPVFNPGEYVMDRRYAPIWWQICISMPDEMQKTIVDNKGRLYYDYINKPEGNQWHTGPFNGCNLAMYPGIGPLEPDSVAQRLLSPEIPVLLTNYTSNKILLSTKIFTVAPAAERLYCQC